jgi:hypothetical protein
VHAWLSPDVGATICWPSRGPELWETSDLLGGVRDFPARQLPIEPSGIVARDRGALVEEAIRGQETGHLHFARGLPRRANAATGYARIRHLNGKPREGHSRPGGWPPKSGMSGIRSKMAPHFRLAVSRD